MPVMKQKSLQPATNVPYAEGIMVLNNTANDIPAGRMVTFQRGANTATSGAVLTVELADASSAARSNQPLLIAKHMIPVGRRGVCLPWMMLTGLDTSALALGASVYLAATAGVTAGQPRIAAGAPANTRFVGLVFEVSATTGRIFLCPTMMAAQN
jgi:hypothetical protein